MDYIWNNFFINKISLLQDKINLENFNFLNIYKFIIIKDKIKY